MSYSLSLCLGVLAEIMEYPKAKLKSSSDQACPCLTP